MSLRRFSRPAIAGATALLLTLPPATLPGQSLVIDEGTFSLFRANERIGREDFGIRRTRGGAGGAYVAQGNLLLGEERLAVVLNVDSAGAPLRVQLETRREGQLVRAVQGERQRGIWSGRISQPAGESAREFRLQSDLFLLEPGIAHHLWFVIQFGEGRPLTILTPSGPSQQRVTLQEQAPGRVALGLRELVARRWLIRSEASGSVLWEVWTDGSGRLLRAIHRPSGVEALRDDPPAETRQPS